MPGCVPVIAALPAQPTPKPTAGQPHARRLAIKAIDSVQTRAVRFGAHTLPNPPAGEPLFDALKQKGYYPSVLRSEKELPEVVDFIYKVFDEATPKPEYLAEFKRILEEGGFTYVIRNQADHQIAGTATLKPDGFIFSVGVAKAHRRNKIATTLMQGLIAEARRQKIPALTLESPNPAAIKLYKSLGFKTQRIRNSDNWHSMALDLQPKSLLNRILDSVQTAIGWVYCKLKALFEWLFPSFIPAEH